MILTGSRYMGQPVVNVATDDLGNSTATVFGPAPTVPNSFSFYTVLQGDRFDTIASKVYGIPDYWWRIADANPEVYYPDILTVGSLLRIPAG